MCVGITDIVQSTILLCPHLTPCSFLLAQEKFTTCSATSPPSGLSQSGAIAIGVVVGLLGMVAIVIAALIVVAVVYKCRRGGGGKSYS